MSWRLFLDLLHEVVHFFRIVNAGELRRAHLEVVFFAPTRRPKRNGVLVIGAYFPAWCNAYLAQAWVRPRIGQANDRTL